MTFISFANLLCGDSSFYQDNHKQKKYKTMIFLYSSGYILVLESMLSLAILLCYYNILKT